MGRVLVPELSSVLSAFGAATADIRLERVRSLAMVLPGDASSVAKAGRELTDGVLAELANAGVDPAMHRSTSRRT